MFLNVDFKIIVNIYKTKNIQLFYLTNNPIQIDVIEGQKGNIH